MQIIENTEQEKYTRAKKRLEEIKGFYWHLFVGVLVIPMVVIINWLTTDFPWSLFAIGGYLLSLIIHWFSVFKRGVFFNEQWEQKKIKELMQEEENNHKQLYN